MLVAIVVVVVSVVLRNSANNGADARACCAGNQCPFDPAPKNGTQHPTGGPSDQCTLARTDPTLVIVAIVPAAVVPVIAAAYSAACSLVEIVLVVTGLSSRWQRDPEGYAQKQHSGQSERKYSPHHSSHPSTWMPPPLG